MFHYFLLNLDSIYFYFIILRFPFYSAFIYISRKDKKIICLHKFNMMPLSIRQKRFVFVFVFTLPSVLYLGSFPRTRSSHAMCVTRIHCGPQKRILNAVVWKYWSLLWSSPPNLSETLSTSEGPFPTSSFEICYWVWASICGYQLKPFVS